MFMFMGVCVQIPEFFSVSVYTGWVRLIRSHSSARFCFELSGNLNYKIICNSNLAKNFELEISLN